MPPVPLPVHLPTHPLLEVRGICKRFGGTAALADVTLAVAAGETHAIVGENGAGKSTLIKILSGNLRPDAGNMRLGGVVLAPASPAAARRLGISVIHQELSIIGDLTVAENVFLGALPTRAYGRVDFPKLRVATRDVLHRLGLTIDPDTRAGTLPIALQQMVEIAKGVASGARVVIMDEPTSSLGPAEAERLWAVTEDLKRQGTTVLFVSHKLDEVLGNADRITVLRDGHTVASEPVSALDVSRLVALMVGRDIVLQASSTTRLPGDVVLAVRGLSRAGAFADVSFEVRAGEILGFAGLVGAGRTEVMRCVFGADTPDSGDILLQGRPVPTGDPRAAITAGIGLVSENRKEQGLFLNLGIRENMSMPASHTGRFGVLKQGAERQAAAQAIEQLGVAARSIEQGVATLSGGNQQKVILARWLLRDPKLLIIDEPTRGIDVGAKAEIYAILRAQAEAGRAIIVVSSELPEVLALADRVAVMREGRIAGVLSRSDATETSLGKLALGG